MSAILATLCYVPQYLKYFIMSVEGMMALCVFGIIVYTIVELEPSPRNYAFFGFCIVLFSLFVADIFTISNMF